MAYLQKKTKDIVIREYLKDPLTKNELDEIIQKTGISASDLIRTQEEEFKKNLKGKSLSEEAYINAILKHPRLLKRPLIIKGNQGVWADPPEEMDVLF